MGKLRKDIKTSVFKTLTWGLGATGTLAAVTLSWWLKIEEARAHQHLTEAALGQQIEAGRVWLTPVALHHDEGKLFLEAVVENPTGETQPSPFGSPARLPELVDGDQSFPADEVFLMRDAAPLLALQPRLSERLRFVWTLKAAPRKGAVIRFSKQTFKLQDNFYGQASWLGFSAVAELPLDSGNGL